MTRRSGRHILLVLFLGLWFATAADIEVFGQSIADGRVEVHLRSNDGLMPIVDTLALRRDDLLRALGIAVGVGGAEQLDELKVVGFVVTGVAHGSIMEAESRQARFTDEQRNILGSGVNSIYIESILIRKRSVEDRHDLWIG